MDPETLKLLDEQDWNSIGKHLVGFAVHRARNYHWRRGGPWELAAGETVEDIVQEVILKTIEGKRNWDPDKGPLVPWLRDQVKSEVDHLCNSWAHQHEEPVPQSEDGEDLTDVVDDSACGEQTAGPRPSRNPEEIVLTREEIERRADALFRAADGDAELEEVLEAVANCDPKPRYLAVEIGVPVDDIYNRMKRLRRHARKILEGGDS